jgi:hypothetical protein
MLSAISRRTDMAMISRMREVLQADDDMDEGVGSEPLNFEETKEAMNRASDQAKEDCEELFKELAELTMTCLNSNMI